MSYGQFVSILRARWKLALAVFLLIVGLGVAVTLLLPKQYTASASVVVDARPDPVNPFQIGSTASLIATQSDIILSDRVARRAIRSLKLAQNPQVRQQWQDDQGGKGDIETWLAGLFSKNLAVVPSRDSNVITVSYKAPDPNFAAAIVNAFVQSYIDTTLELRVSPARQCTSFFDQRTKEAREQLESAQTRVSEFQRSKGIIASDERLDIESARLNELSSQLVMLQAVASESGSRQAQAIGASGDRLQEVLTNPLVSGLKADLTRAEGKLQELNARYGSNHPQVIEAQANITELRSRIDVEIKRVMGGVGLTNTINRQREAQTRAELELQRTKVLKMKAVRDEGAVLLRDLDNAQKTYDAVVARFNQTSLESQTTQSNVNVLSSAPVPIEPSFPKPFLNFAVAFVLGILMAVGIVMIREILDRRTRSIEDVKGFLGLPVIGVLPGVQTTRRASKRRHLMIQQRVLGHLPAPKGGA